MRTINIRSILKIAGLILIITSASFLCVFPVALIQSEPYRPFIPCITDNPDTRIVDLFLHPEFTARKHDDQGRIPCCRPGLAILIIAGTLPYFYSGEIKGTINILFETASGYTTTGASILTDVEIYLNRYFSGAASHTGSGVLA